jgi:hypothetical protein
LRTYHASAVRVVAGAALVAFLGGCTAGAGTSLPAAANAANPFSSSTLYVAAADRVNAFNLDAAGTTAPNRSITIVNPSFITSSKIAAIATRAGGVLGVLEDVVDVTYPSETIIVEVSASANGSVTPPGTFGFCGSYGSTACHGTGLVHMPSGAWAALLRGAVGHRLQYVVDGLSPVAGSNTQLARSSGLAIDGGSHLYLSGAPTDPSGIDKYKFSDLATLGSLNQPAPPVETTTTLPNGTATGPIAVGPDLRTYVAALDASNNAIVDVFTQAGGSAPFVYSTSLGPFYDRAIDALAVDAQGNLYVALFALNASAGVTEVRVYTPGAFGAPAALLRTLLNPVPSRITSLAILQ